MDTNELNKSADADQNAEQESQSQALAVQNETQREVTESNPLDQEPEPEIIHEKFDEEPVQKEEKSVIASIFSDLNDGGNANKKLFGIVGGVLGIAFLTIFMMDAFGSNTNESQYKDLDLNKKTTQATVTPKSEQEVAGDQAIGPVSGKNTATPTTAKKVVPTNTPVPTAAPTNTPVPTATPTKAPDPTATPTPSPTTAEVSTPTPTTP